MSLDQCVVRSAGCRVKPGEVWEVSLTAPRPGLLVPEKIPIDIVHEDPSVIVLNKPAGMVVHPGRGNRSGTLVERAALPLW